VCDKETSKTRRLKPATGLWKIQPQWVVTSGKQTNIYIRSVITCRLKFIEKTTRNFNYDFSVMSKYLFAAFIAVIGNVSGLNFSLESTGLKLIPLTIETVFLAENYCKHIILCD
jgi:hypothetical protein